MLGIKKIKSLLTKDGEPGLHPLALVQRIPGRILSHPFAGGAAGMATYYLRPEHGDLFGGPFNGQMGRRRMFDAVVQAVRPVAILETGTFRGTTTEYLASTGLPVRTVEAQARDCGFARARLRKLRNVEISLGDSRECMRDWVANPDAPFKGQRVFAYLDAHWDADLPLAEELQILFANCPGATAMIDDFEVPGDPGYGFDAYAGKNALTREYIADATSRFQLTEFYPALASADETGARRGCVVLCRAPEDIAALAARAELRSSRQAAL